MGSVKLAQKGFLVSKYSKKELKNGDIAWDTIQRNQHGETASWHGKWNGRIMKGILSIRSAEGTIRDFSFVSSGERRKGNE